MKHSFSFWSLLILYVSVVVFSFSYYPKYQKQAGEATISWDVSGYYWYLPATFIYHDLKELKFTDSVLNTYQCSPDNQQITYLPDGNKVLKYSSGMAVQYAPFFFVAHLLAKPLGYVADGFSKPYQISLQIGALIMMFFGLWYLRKLLLIYFKDSIVTWAIVLLVIGTNYLNYVSIDVGMSHTWLFAWYCILMYQSEKLYHKISVWRTVFIGLILGLLALSRPTEIIAILIPLLWGIQTCKIDLFTSRFKFIISHYTYYFIAIVVMLMVGSFQLFYWKYTTNHWLVYSYGDQKFSWLQPHLKDYLISFRCGWLLYCPMMIVPIIGIYFLIKKQVQLVPVLLFLFLYTWIVTAWDIWFYGGRAMIQGYAVFMFPFCAFLEWVNTQKIIKYLIYLFIGLFIYLNIWWIHGCHNGGYIYATDMTKAYYKKIVGQFSIDERDRKFLDIIEDYSGKKIDKKIVLTNAVLNKFKGNEKLHLQKQTKAEYYYPINVHLIKQNWIRFIADVNMLQPNWDSGRMSMMGIQLKNDGKVVKENRILLDRLFYKYDKQMVWVDATLPKEKYNEINVFFRNDSTAQGEFIINSFSVENFN